MKSKHSPIGAAALLIISGLAVCWMLRGPAQLPAKWEPLGDVAKIASLQVPDPLVLEEMSRLETRLAEIAYPKPPAFPVVHLEIFGYQPSRESRMGVRGKKVLLAPRIHHLITLAFSSSKRSFCVVDGKFYPEGSSLPDGTRILRVEHDRVLMEKGAARNWIPVAGKTKTRGPETKSMGDTP